MKINCKNCIKEINISADEEEFCNEMINNSEHIFCSEQCRNDFSYLRESDLWLNDVVS
jgi:hypothetical protein